MSSTPSLPSYWRYRIDTRRDGMAAGITFVMAERLDGEAEAAKGPRKLTLEGRVSLTLALNQKLYGDQLIAQLYTLSPGVVEERRADGYNRIQVYLGPADLSMATMLEDMAATIRSLQEPRA